MGWKFATAMLAGFSAGMVFTVACTTGGVPMAVPGVGTAHADTEASSCSKWEYAESVEEVATCDDDSECAVPEGWEPIGAYAHNSSNDIHIALRRCAD